jgi:WD40 repeat protein
MTAETTDDRCDVFVSFSSADRASAQALDSSLQKLGLRTFLNTRDMPSGVPWIDALEGAVDKSRAVALLLGRWGLDNGQHYERTLALIRQSREPDFPVVPILLPGCQTPTAGFLELRTWIDLRDGLDRPDTLAALADALRGKPRGSAPVRETVCPYMGLEPFREEDAAVFCGRDKLVAELVSRVKAHPLVAIVGRSGSGKSSLVFAGLLPHLRRQKPGVIWDVLSLRPGAWPLHSLAAAFHDGATRSDGVSPDAAIATATDQLRVGGDETLSILASQRLDHAPGRPDKLLLYIDQWEELYSLGDVERFIALLVSLASDARARTRIVLTIRADYYASLLGSSALSAIMPRQQVNIGSLSRDEMRTAIVTPAEKLGLAFDPPSLVDQILDDTGTDEAILPLLQYALKQTWARREGRALTASGYADAGGVRRSLRKAADTTYAALNDHEKAVARSLFVGLVTPGEGREDTRARIPIPSDPTADNVISKFASSPTRLLVTGFDDVPCGDETLTLPSTLPSGRDLMVRGTLEIAHEALIRAWPELRSWLDTNRDVLRSRAVIAHQRREWDTTGRRQELLLRPGVALERGRALLADSGDVPVEDVRDYIELSAKDQERRVEAQRQSELAERQHWVWLARTRAALAIGAATLALVMGVLWIYAFSQWSAASTATRQAKDVLRTTQDDAARALARAAIIASHDETLERETVADALRAAALSTVVLSDPGLVEAGLVALQVAPRLGRLHGHTGAVNSAVFSPDGTRLVTASADKTARIWDAKTGQVIATLQGHAGHVNSASFSPDGTRVVTASEDETARLWDSKSGQLLATIQGHSAAVTCAAFSQAGTRVVTASDDRTARLWDAKTGQQVMTLPGHSARLSAASFSVYDTRLVTASDDKTARVWDANTGQLLSTLQGHTAPVTSATLSPDGTRALTTSDDTTACIWDALSGQLLLTLQGHSGPVSAGAFSPDGTRVVTASRDTTARIWDAKTGQALFTLQGHSGPVGGAAFSANGTRLVTASRDTTARLWDAKTGQLLVVLQGHTGGVNGAGFSQDGSRVATASSDGTARIWDANGGQRPTTVLGSSDWVRSAAFSHDGARVVTASRDKTARLWDAKTGQLVATLQGHTGPVRIAVFSQDDARVLTTSDDKTARVWDAKNGQLLTTLEGHTGLVEQGAFSRDGARIVTASQDRTARVWDANNGQVLATLKGHANAVDSAEFSDDGARVVTASWDNTARLWDAKTGDLVAVLKGHSGAVTSADFSKGGARVVTASRDNTARLWDAKSGQLLTTFQGHTKWVRSAAFSRDGSRVVTASDDGSARTWDAKSGQLLTSFFGHADRVGSGAFSPDDERIVTASDDSTARVWDAKTGQLLATLRGHVHGVNTAAFSPDGLRVVTSSNDGAARLWAVDYKGALGWICATIREAIPTIGPDYQDLRGICSQVPAP